MAYHDKWAAFSYWFNNEVLLQFQWTWYILHLVPLLVSCRCAYEVKFYKKFVNGFQKPSKIEDSFPFEWVPRERVGMHGVIAITFFFLFTNAGAIAIAISFSESSEVIDWMVHIVQTLAPSGWPLLAIFLGDFFNDEGSFNFFTWLSLSIVFLLMSLKLYTDFGLVDTLIAVAVSALGKSHNRWAKATAAAVLCFYKGLVLNVRNKVKQMEDIKARDIAAKERIRELRKRARAAKSEVYRARIVLRTSINRERVKFRAIQQIIEKKKQLELLNVERELHREIERRIERERERERHRESVNQRKARERVKERERLHREIEREIESERERERHRERVNQRKARERVKERER